MFAFVLGRQSGNLCFGSCAARIHVEHSRYKGYPVEHIIRTSGAKSTAWQCKPDIEQASNYLEVERVAS